MAPCAAARGSAWPGGSSARWARRTPPGATASAPAQARAPRASGCRGRPSVVRVVGCAAAIIQAGTRRGLVGRRHRQVLARLGGVGRDREGGGGHRPTVVDGGSRGPAAGAPAGVEL